MKHIIISIVFFLGSTHTMAQTTVMRDVFRQMPDTLLPYLSHNNRLDMVDFFDASMKSDVTNILDGHSQLIELSDNYVKLQLSPVTTVEMLLLSSSNVFPDSTNHLVCVATTIGDYPKETTLNFYTSHWNVLYIDNPLMSERVEKLMSAKSAVGGKKLYDEEATFIEVSIIPSENAIRISRSHMVAPGGEEKQSVPDNLAITLKWDGELFK